MSKGKQGFASMPADRVKEIASMGGQAAQEKGTGHQWTSEEAKLAGQKGGRASKQGQQKQSVNQEG